MAFSVVRRRSDLADPLVLAPERYDPRRSVGASSEKRISDLVEIVRGNTQPGEHLGDCLVLDTSDAREGIVISRHRMVAGKAIGSTKKSLQVGDVIISRLRPYLRQVAYIDAGIPHALGARLLCSTEFHILRPRDRLSIAFLIPFLLCTRAQEVFAAAQEGGHHPRFNEHTLAALAIPDALIKSRDATSRLVENAVRTFRRSETSLDSAVEEAERVTAKAWASLSATTAA